MQLEVEQKFPVADVAQLRERLAALGCEFREPIQQADLYFAHPARDFAETDEALRLRHCVTEGSGVTEGSSEEVCMTYKGPKLDPTTKTRREIELPILGEHGYEQYRELLEVLGFQAVMEVRKCRTPGTIEWEGTEIEVALDDVTGLGTFVELELLAAPAGLEAAKKKLASLAARLDLQGSERRGYLDLLFGK